MSIQYLSRSSCYAPSPVPTTSAKSATTATGPTITGTVRMYPVMRDDMKRFIHVMTMDDLMKFGATDKGAIPDVLEPELLTFSSDRGTMVVGFEEIAGRRCYQGWWNSGSAVLSLVDHPPLIAAKDQSSNVHKKISGNWRPKA